MPVIVSHQELESYVTSLFEATGMEESGAAIVANSLVDADLRGVESHGVMRIPIYIRRLREGLISPVSQGEIEKDVGSLVVLDGKNAMGQVVSYQGMEIAIQKADEFGFGAVGIKHSNHFGAAGYYTRLAAERGYLAISFTNAMPVMPSPGGVKAIVGNNPLSIAAPAGQYRPMVLDMAMSVAAVGKIMMAAKKGEKIPFGWAFDSDGNDTDDPNEALKSGLYNAIGNHKGFGLAIMFDVMCGALLNSAYGEQVKSMTFQWTDPVDCGHFMMAINISSLLPLELFKQHVDNIIKSIKNSGRDGAPNPMYPGEPEHIKERERRESGIPLADKVYEDLKQVGSELGVKMPF